MKKLTKKAIKEAANYIVMIDWKTAYRNELDFEVLTARTIIEAMDEAAERFDENVYMLSIYEKTGETIEGNGLIYSENTRSRMTNTWRTIKAEGCTEGAKLARYFYDNGEEAHLIACSR